MIQKIMHWQICISKSKCLSFRNYLSPVSKLCKNYIKVIFLLQSKHICLQKINQEYSISNNYSAASTRIIITQTEKKVLCTHNAIQNSTEKAEVQLQIR